MEEKGISSKKIGFKFINLSRSREKEAPAKQAFTFPGAISTKSKVRSTADTKWLDFGGEEMQKYEFEERIVL